MSTEEVYDVVIIGAGPSGLTSAIYTARANMKTLLVEKESPGGQMMATEAIENYPGYESILGPELSDKMYQHALKFGTEFLSGQITSIRDEGLIKSITIDEKYVKKTKSIIISSGANHRKLGVKGEEQLSGRGVSYCAVCDGAFFEDLEVVVVGGGDSAVEEAVFLTRFASKVTIIHRRDKLKAQKILQKRAFENEKIHIVWNHEVKEVKGNGMVETVLIEDVNNGEQQEYPCNGVFIYIGMDPVTNFILDLAITNDDGYILTDEEMRTTIPGILAAGDVREKTLRQVANATGDGSIAAMSAHHYIENMEEDIKRNKKEAYK
jgi:thioredoxin reductase (NADPH)